MAKILVLHSGGMDSTACLYQAHASGHDVVSLGVDYGQSLSVEMLFASEQCKKKGIDRQVVNVRWAKPERHIPLDRTADEMSKTVSSAFLPGRNVVFLSLGLAHGAGISADEVWTGINSVDFSGYPDCTPQFYDAFRSLQEVAAPGGPKIKAPLLMMTKPEIAALAHSVGIGRNDTWSCYRPEIHDGAIKPCERCDACKLHNHAWDHMKVS
jgi:7-cyano-7-deazaguanine synthase